MIDYVSITGAMLAAGAVAGGLLLVIGLAVGKPRAVAVGGALGVALGAALGWWWLEVRPHWPAKTGLDRLLLFVIPAATLVEVVAVFPGPRWLAHALRLTASLAVPGVLLRGSRYINDWAGPGTRDWSEGAALGYCASLGAALALGWIGMTELARRSPRRGHVLSLALCCAVAGPVVMLSAYKSGGEMAFPLTACLLGAAIASVLIPAGATMLEGVIGVGIAALYGILFLGVFFAKLTPLHAALLFAAPLACWIPEIPFIRRRGPWWRSTLRLLLVGSLLAFVLWRALPQAGSEPSPTDPYQDYRP